MDLNRKANCIAKSIANYLPLGHYVVSIIYYQTDRTALTKIKSALGFKTVAREIGASDRVTDAIQGHAARTAGDSYGDVTLKAKQAAIERMPSYLVEMKI